MLKIKIKKVKISKKTKDYVLKHSGENEDVGEFIILLNYTIKELKARMSDKEIQDFVNSFLK